MHVVVANDPWQKSAQRPVTSAFHRLEMTRRAFSGIEGIEISDVEIQRGGPSYTMDTVALIGEAQIGEAHTDTVLVVGLDAVAGLHSWHRADELARRVTLAVVQPPDSEPIELGHWRTVSVAMPPMAASSTRVRDLLSIAATDTNRPAGDVASEALRKAAEVLPEAVMSYIADFGLYSA